MVQEREPPFLELIRRAKQNDVEAMEELFVRNRPLLKKYARKLGYEDAEQDLAEWFIRAVRKYPLGDGVSIPQGRNEEKIEDKGGVKKPVGVSLYGRGPRKEGKLVDKPSN